MIDTLGARARAALLATFRAPPVRPDFERLGVIPDGGAYYFDDVSGTFRVVYERGHLPTPGAQAYAYMSLAVPPQAICGAGFDIQGPGWNAFQPRQAYNPQSVGITGLGTAAGQVATQPLTGNVNGSGSAM